MKKAIVLLLLLSMVLSGCGMWMDGSYHHVVPHLHEHQSPGRDKIAVKSYEELQNAILSLVEEGTTKAVIFLQEELQQQAEVLVPQAISYVQKSSAVGAYALENVKYDVGNSKGMPAVALEFSYRHGRSELLRIKRANTMGDAANIIEVALDNCNAGVVIYVEDYEETDFTQMVQDYVDASPWNCMEMPQVAEMVYPDFGEQRIVELSFAYQNSRDALRVMQQNVKTVFSSAELYVQGNAQPMEKFSQLYSFLMERYDYKIETSITPAYSLLCHGVGDDKAFAMVYSAMCKKAGLNCKTISGTKAGEPWYWNIIQDGDTHYHVDLLRCTQIGGFAPLADEDMEGYVWDYSAYPAQNTRR